MEFERTIDTSLIYFKSLLSLFSVESSTRWVLFSLQVLSVLQACCAKPRCMHCILSRLMSENCYSFRFRSVITRSHKRSHQLNGVGCQLTAVKTRNPKIHRSTWVKLILCIQLTSLQFDKEDPFHGQLTAVTTRYPLNSIAWPYRRLKCRTHRGHAFLKFTADQVMDFHWIAGSSNFTIIKTSQKIEAPLLGLAKSIY